MSRWIVVLAALLTFSSAGAQTLKVRHDHDPWGKCVGELSFSENGIVFSSEKEEHNWSWGWTDIQTVDRRSESEFSILSYADQKFLLGRDRPFDFTVLEGRGMDDTILGLIQSHLPRPVVDRLPEEVERVDYEVNVKHLHTFGGCEGVLRFGPDVVVYDTPHAKDARTWRMGSAIVGVWSVGKFDLELEVYEREGGDLLRTRRFRFQLKEPLDPDFYYHLRRKLVPVR